MPRNISFALTTSQIQDRSKTVTRRRRWLFLKRGDVLNACVKCMGLKPGEKIQRLALIRVVDVRRERLDKMETLPGTYGFDEASKEGLRRKSWTTKPKTKMTTVEDLSRFDSTQRSRGINQ